MGIRISEMEEATTFGADDYVPIVTSGTNKKALGAKIKDFIAGFFVSKSGDTMTGDLSINATNAKTKCINPDMIIDTSANNNLSADSDYGVSVTDKNGAIAGSFNVSTRANGQVVTSITANNKETDGTDISNFIAVIMAKNGERSYYIPDKGAFRKAISVNNIIVDSFTRSITIAANSNMAWNAYTESAKSGYGAIGIIQFQTNNQYIVPANLCLDNSSYGIFLKNISGSSQTGTFKYTVLYVKND